MLRQTIQVLLEDVWVGPFPFLDHFPAVSYDHCVAPLLQPVAQPLVAPGTNEAIQLQLWLQPCLHAQTPAQLLQANGCACHGRACQQF